jgi:hypothetical protein
VTAKRYGRPPKLTAERSRIVVKAIRDGNTRACAAALAGIDPDTLQEWLRKGREGDPAYARFAEEVRSADGRIESRMVGTVRKCGTNDWRAAMAWLGARRTKSWGERSTVTLKKTGEDLSGLSDEKLDQLLALIAEAKKATTP